MAVLQIVFDGGLYRNTFGVRFVRQLVNSQTELLRLPGDWGRPCSLRCGLLRVVLDPLILAGAVTDANKVGSALGRFRPSTDAERSIPPACSRDLLPIVDSLNCHLIPPCKAVQGSTIAMKNVALCSMDGNSTIKWDFYMGGGEGGIRTH